MLYDLIIIGGGPAGITAGLYASRQKIKVLLITKQFGGQMAEKAVLIENWPGIEKISGQELIQKFVYQLKKQEIEIKMDEVVELKKQENVFFVKTKSGEEFGTIAVIIATGAEPRRLNIEGEKNFLGKGVSYCVTCDGPVFKNKVIAVIGGGNVGFEAAIFLTKYAVKVYILEEGEAVRADIKTVEEAKQTGKIEILTSAKIKKIEGSVFVEKMIYEDNKTKKENELKIDGVFILAGRVPATNFLNNLTDFNERKEVMVEPEILATKTPGLFAAGDVRKTKLKQIITACSDGARAAISAYQYINGLKIKK